jgi:hypothetical protein
MRFRRPWSHPDHNHRPVSRNHPTTGKPATLPEGSHLEDWSTTRACSMPKHNPRIVLMHSGLPHVLTPCSCRVVRVVRHTPAHLVPCTTTRTHPATLDASMPALYIAEHNHRGQNVAGYPFMSGSIRCPTCAPLPAAAVTPAAISRHYAKYNPPWMPAHHACSHVLRRPPHTRTLHSSTTPRICQCPHVLRCPSFSPPHSRAPLVLTGLAPPHSCTLRSSTTSRICRRATRLVSRAHGTCATSRANPTLDHKGPAYASTPRALLLALLCFILVNPYVLLAHTFCDAPCAARRSV